MLDNHYEVNTSPDLLTFEFISTGPKGHITKIVRYTELNVKGFYNLGFGDKDPITGYISDRAITTNNNSKKVLATVASTLYAFTANYAEATIIATGCAETRTRLYRIGISNYLMDIQKDFVVFGLQKPFGSHLEKTPFIMLLW